MTKSQKCSLAKMLVVHSSGHFGKPVVESAEERKQNAAHDHIVKVRDHEVRPASCQLKGAAPSMMPVRPAIKN